MYGFSFWVCVLHWLPRMGSFCLEWYVGDVPYAKKENKNSVLPALHVMDMLSSCISGIR
jgi:hypothetical protein